MKFTLLNLKTLLLFSGIIIGFANPINATDYNSNNTDSTKYNDSWSSTKTNKYKSKYGFGNKDENKPCYGPNCDVKKKYHRDDYDIKRSKYESDFDVRKRREDKPCIGKDCNNKTKYSGDNIKSNTYKSNFDLRNERGNKPCIGENCSTNSSLNELDKYDYSDYHYGNFDFLDEAEKEFDAIVSNNDKIVPCVGSECESSRVGSNYNDKRAKEDYDSPKYKPARFFASFGFFSETKTDKNGTQVKQEQHGILDDYEHKRQKLDVFSSGDSNNGISTNKHDSTLNYKSGSQKDNDDSWNETYNEWKTNKNNSRRTKMLSDDGRQFGENFFNENVLNKQERYSLPSDNCYNNNKHIESKVKQLPDNNYYGNKNMYRTSYSTDNSNTNSLIEEDVE